MRIKDSNKDNYKQNSEQFDHKCTYIIHKCTYKCTLTMTECNLCAALSAGALCLVHALYSSSCCYEYCMHA